MRPEQKMVVGTVVEVNGEEGEVERVFANGDVYIVFNKYDTVVKAKDAAKLHVIGWEEPEN